MRALFSLALLLLSLVALAEEQSQSTVKIGDQSTQAAYRKSGNQVEIVKPFFTYQLNTAVTGTPESESKTDAKDGLGIALGYNFAVSENIGLTPQLKTITVSTDSDSLSIVSLGVMANVALADKIQFIAGVNASKLSQKVLIDLDPAVGFQAGLALQAMPELAFQLQYSEFNQKGDKNGIHIEAKQSGAELGLAFIY